MRLTPLDIRKQEFSRRFRGFDAEEVQAFLSMLSNQWEEIIDESRRRDEKIRELSVKLAHYEKVEEALQEALHTARDTSRKAVENAEQKAQLILERAESRAENIKMEAENERHQMKRETAKLSGRRSEIVSRLRAFLMSEMELLARFEGDDPVGFIKLLPADEHRLRQPAESDRPVESFESRTETPHEEVERPVDAYDSGGAHEDESDAGRDREEGDEWTDDEYYGASEGDYSSEEGYIETDLPGEEEPERERPGEGVLRGPGWTAHTVIARPPEPRPTSTDSEDDGDSETENRRVSSDEIEKIRRILSDLD